MRFRIVVSRRRRFASSMPPTSSFCESMAWAGHSCERPHPEVLSPSQATAPSPASCSQAMSFTSQRTSSTDGVAIILGVNRLNNRQLWIADSANMTPNTTNSLLRVSWSLPGCGANVPGLSALARVHRSRNGRC